MRTGFLTRLYIRGFVWCIYSDFSVAVRNCTLKSPTEGAAIQFSLLPRSSLIDSPVNNSVQIRRLVTFIFKNSHAEPEPQSIGNGAGKNIEAVEIHPPPPGLDLNIEVISYEHYLRAGASVSLVLTALCYSMLHRNRTGNCWYNVHCIIIMLRMAA